MLFSVLSLLLLASSSRATLPDVRSFMPNIFAMLPMNGQISLNDQVFAFGDSNPVNTRANTPESQTIPQEFVGQLSPTNVINIPNSFTQNTPQVITRGIPQSQPQNTLQIPIVEMRAQEIPSFLLNTRPNINNGQNLQTNGFTNFDSRIPSFDSRVSGFGAQNPNTNFNTDSLPNIGSTEVGSTFANNANSNFADEFSRPSPASSMPFGGLPFPNNQFTGPTPPVSGRSSFDQREDPLVVMPLVVSPDRLLGSQANGSTPLPMPSLFVAASNVNERREPLESVPAVAATAENEKSIAVTLPHDSVKVSRETTSFILPMPTITQIPTEYHSDPALRQSLERLLPPVLPNDTSVHTINASDIESSQHFHNTIIPINFADIFRPQIIPSLVESDSKSQSQEQSPLIETTTSSESSTKSN